MIDILILEMGELEDAESRIAGKRREAARKALLELRDKLGRILAITGLAVRVDHGLRLTGRGFEYHYHSDCWLPSELGHDGTLSIRSVTYAVSYSKVLKEYLEKDLPNISRSLKLRNLEEEYLEVRNLLVSIRAIEP